MPNPFGLDKRADGRTHTHTLLMSERMRDQMKIPFNIVWNFSLAFSSLLLRSILGGSFWIFHYLMNSYEFGESKAISHVHVHGQMATHLRISSKNKVILIIITNRFFFLYLFFVLCAPLFIFFLLLFHFCTFDFVAFHLLLFSGGPHFSFVDFLYFCYLRSVFILYLVCLCVCDFVILPQFEYAITDHKRINILIIRRNWIIVAELRQWFTKTESSPLGKEFIKDIFASGPMKWKKPWQMNFMWFHAVDLATIQI